MEIEIARADPAGNITVFVLSRLGSAERARAAKALLADPDLKAEQVGFVTAPAVKEGIWRLEMAGGEFCGNASRSFGLLVAAECGLTGKHVLSVEISGMSGLLPVDIDTDTQSAGIEIPEPLDQTVICLGGQYFPVYEFEGITHIIAENMLPDERAARSIIWTYNEGRRSAGKQPCSALGVMFYDAPKCFMQPIVWTQLETLVCESSCGSGSAALGVWAVRDSENTETVIELGQPGGILTVSVEKQAGRIKRLSISGKVSMSGTFRYCLD